MIDRNSILLLAAVLAGSSVVSPAWAQSPAPAVTPAVSAQPRWFHASQLPRRAEMYYGAFWGIGSLSVKAVESGELIRFSWRVLDPDKAKALSDKKSEPFLLDPKAGVKLVIPSLEKVGQLRQSQTPEAGKSYWMAFSNQGRIVKPGDRVDVVIGKFRAAGLVVE